MLKSFLKLWEKIWYYIKPDDNYLTVFLEILVTLRSKFSEILREKTSNESILKF